CQQNSPPTLSGTPNGTVLENSFYEFAPDANDANGDPLTFTITNKPAWADFDPTTGALYGTPTAADVGHYDAIGIAVSDGQATAELPGFAIDVTSVALGSVTLSWVPPSENTDGSPLTDLAGYRIYYGVDPQNYSDVIEITNASLTSYVVDNLTPNTWYFAATALNSSGVESTLSSPAARDIF
ncbi:MAG: putative Ig domain-containing protein, partial [Gammaproteobacteria bacterium]|nr:putative Ig domain-containing protein [Gammaproteobacteria bacterium]